MKFLLFLLFITISSANSALREDWIDPHEIKINAKQKLKRSMSENDQEDILKHKSNVNTNTTPNVDENTSLMFLKRAVNLILNSAGPEKHDPTLFVGSYQFKTETEEHNFLIDFANKKSVNADDIRRLDTILSSVFFKQPESFFNVHFYKEDLSSLIFHTNFLIIFGPIVCLFVIYVLFKNNFGFFYILSYCVFVVLIVDFALRYQFLYEEAEKHNLKLLYSENCDTTTMSWGEYLKFAFQKRDCERKIVTPLDVALNQLKNIIIIPLESVGTGMGKLGKELFEKLPFPWNILLFPLMLIFIIAVVFFFTIALKDSPFEFNLLHLISMKFGKHNDDKNRISGKTLDKLLEATTSHRPMVQDTKSSPENKVYKRKKNKNNSPPKSIENDNKNKKENLNKDLSTGKHEDSKKDFSSEKKDNLEKNTS